MDNKKLLEEWSIYVAQVQAQLQPYKSVDSKCIVEHFDIYRPIGVTDTRPCHVWQLMRCAPWKYWFF